MGGCAQAGEMAGVEDTSDVSETAPLSAHTIID